MTDFFGKKLLLLGGIRAACEIVKEAHKMGVTVYVTDYLADSPAKAIADKSFMVSATDVDAVVELCKKEKIDGVFTGYVDSLLPYCERICKKLDVPFWGNQENIEICINKEKFKIACVKAGVKVVPWKKVTPQNYQEALQNVELPVVVKPTDNSGSRGIFKCYSYDEMMIGCEKAFAFSKAKELLVEKMMDCDQEFSVYYLLNNGKPYFTGMGDRFVNSKNAGIAPIGQGMLFPSKRQTAWKEKMDAEVRNFFIKNDMKDGVVFLQGFEDKGDFYIHEIGYRLNGGFSYKIFEEVNQYNQVQELIKFALSGGMDTFELAKIEPDFDGCGFILTISLLPGQIGTIRGVEEAKKTPGVLEFCQMHEVGECLLSKGTTAQVFAYVICTAKNRKDLAKTIDAVKEVLAVTDTEGNNLLSDIIDSPKIIQW